MSGDRKAGWDLRIVCTVCGFRSRKNRYEGADGALFGNEPPATFEADCYNCSAEAGCYEPMTVTKHFVDIATDAEMNDPKYSR
jgi:hypothetical protein